MIQAGFLPEWRASRGVRFPAFASLPPSREALRRDHDEARRAESGRRGTRRTPQISAGSASSALIVVASRSLKKAPTFSLQAAFFSSLQSCAAAAFDCDVP